MSQKRPDIYNAYSLDGSYILAQHLGLRHIWPRVASALGSLCAVGCGLLIIFFFDGLSEVMYAMIFALCALYLSGLFTMCLAKLYWRSERAHHEKSVLLAQRVLDELEDVSSLEPAQIFEYALAAFVTTVSLGASPVKPDAITVDIETLDALCAKRGVNRPKMFMNDVRAVLTDPAVTEFHEAESIRLPAVRPMLLLPWLALSTVAWIIWIDVMSNRALGIALGSLLVAGFTMAQAFHGQKVWSLADWRIAPGRLGRCEIRSSVEAASDTHIMLVTRMFDGSMQLVFVNSEGTSLIVNAGRRRGKRYRRIWREWLYEGTPAPPLVERISGKPAAYTSHSEEE